MASSFNWSDIPEDVSSLTVKTLKDHLHTLELSSAGNKAALVERLINARENALQSLQVIDPKDDSIVTAVTTVAAEPHIPEVSIDVDPPVVILQPEPVIPTIVAASTSSSDPPHAISPSLNFATSSENDDPPINDTMTTQLTQFQPENEEILKSQQNAICQKEVTSSTPPLSSSTVSKSQNISKAALRRQKKNQNRQDRKGIIKSLIEENALDKNNNSSHTNNSLKKLKDDDSDDYAMEPLPILDFESVTDYDDDKTVVLAEFSEIFEKFQKLGSRKDIASADANENEANNEKDENNKHLKTIENSNDDYEDNNEGISRRQKRLQNQIKVSELKQLISRVDVVETWDVTAPDPRLLVYLKAYRNTVPVPKHWNQKRKYLSAKRGTEKLPFQLPEHIAATGIQKIRDSYLEKESSKTSKQKSRDRTTPKSGAINIDYQVLHDAFFRFATKPKLTSVGEVYYEGKEFEADSKGLRERYRPGLLSTDLKVALGMVREGAIESTIPIPPPWLVNMQRYGPPPSYPNLSIPGLNAPLPPGASYGYHAGGWGKPPVDQFGRPLYGDVFGVTGTVGVISGGNGTALTPEEIAEATRQRNKSMQNIDRSFLWGEKMDVVQVESDDDDEVEEEPVAIEDDKKQGDSDDDVDGDRINDGHASVLPGGMETPAGALDLRKVGRRPDNMNTTSMNEDDDNDTPKQLYKVLPQRSVGQSTALMGSAHVYDVSNESQDIALDPSELEQVTADPQLLERKLAENAGVGNKRKQPSGNQTDPAANKKFKDFKF